MAVYSVRHVTNFSYDPVIRESVVEVRMQPFSDANQRCLAFSLDVTPTANLMLYQDFLGNTVHHFDIPGRHNRLKITANALVELEASPVPTVSDVGTWDDLDRLLKTEDHWEMLMPSHFATPTPLLMELAEELKLARSGNPLELLTSLNQALYDAFEYMPNSTKVDSPIDDALRSRQGVCQDLAHIMIVLCRQIQIPARYVSGYLFHGENARDRSPESATHAWMEAFLPGPGWLAFDPTNNLIGGARHIRVAIGRDYADVPPTRGVYKGDVSSELSVAVTVTPAEAPLPEVMPRATVIRSKPLTWNTPENLQYEQQQQ